MNTSVMAGSKPYQKLNPLSLLSQVVNRQSTGCLRVSNESASWLVFLEGGKLTYASNSVDPFKRLDRHLRRLSTQFPDIENATKMQMGLLFEVPLGQYSSDNRDYQAIRWLIKQGYLNLPQAVTLIGDLAEEVIASLLLVREGTYELIDQDKFDDFPKLCQLDLRTVIRASHSRLRQHQTLAKIAKPSPSLPTVSNQNGTHSASTVALPDAPQNRDLTDHTPGSTPQNPAASAPQKTYTIICIDDSPAVLSAIKSFLDDGNFSVITISNPVSALMQIVRSKPDLILLDIGMPNLDGYELCSLLRRHPSFRETPIIMVTGNTGFVDRAKAKLVRASGYLTKPFTRSDLLKMIFKFLT